MVELVANTRIALARLLASAGRFDDAVSQIRKALEYRSQNNFSVPQALVQMVDFDWFRSRANRADLPKEPDAGDAAEAIVFGGEIVYRAGIIDNQNAKKQLAHVAFSTDDGVVLPYGRFKDISDMEVGNIIEVGLADDHRAVRWRKSAAITLDGFYRQFAGKLTHRPGQLFGFVITEASERIYVHPDLMETAPPVGPLVLCRAVMGKDRQGKQGWRALTPLHRSGDSLH